MSMHWPILLSSNSKCALWHGHIHNTWELAQGSVRIVLLIAGATAAGACSSLFVYCLAVLSFGLDCNYNVFSCYLP